MSNLNKHVQSDKVKWIITGIVLVLILAILGGVLAAVLTEINPKDWFTKDESEGDDSISPTVTASYTPIEEGDFVKRIYFNKDFDVKSLFPGDVNEVCSITLLSSVYDDMVSSGPSSSRMKSVIVGHPSLATETNDAAADTVGIYYLYPNEYQVIYLSAACSMDGVEYEAGWQIEGDYLEISTPVEYIEDLFNDADGLTIIGGSFSCEVRQIYGQNIFKYFISADGIFADAIVDEYVPVEEGDVVRKLYFNTELDLKEFVSESFDIFGFAAFSPAICLDGGGVRLMCMPVGLLFADVESFEDFNAIKDEIAFVAVITGEVKVLYSSCTFESAEYGTVEVPGWQVDSLDLVEVYGKGAIVGSIDNTQPVTGANIFKYFVSQSEVFADSVIRK